MQETRARRHRPHSGRLGFLRAKPSKCKIQQFGAPEPDESTPPQRFVLVGVENPAVDTIRRSCLPEDLELGDHWQVQDAPGTFMDELVKWLAALPA